jgi:uncharacterized protein (DUF58 family)
MSIARRIFGTTIRVYNRTLRITREGWFFTVFTFAVGVAAINTGNNLMYLVLAMMLSVIVISGILSENVLKSIRLERRLPPEAWAATPFNITYIITNPKRFMLLKVGAGENVLVEGRFIASRRGLLQLTEARLTTRFPFGLFEKTKLIYLKDNLVIYPALIDSDDLLKGSTEQGMEESGLVRGDGAGLFGLRDYQDGDNPRRIYWKASAKSGKLIMKETEADDLPMIAIVLDDTGYRRDGNDEALERAVSRCAGLSETLINRGYMVRLITSSGEIPYGGGIGRLRRILTELALFNPQPVSSSMAMLRHGEARVIIKVLDN